MDVPTAAWRRIAPQLGRFGVVGAAAYLVDVAVFNAALAVSFQLAPDGKPLAAKTVSTIAAMTVGYIGNRQWAFRAPPGTPHTHTPIRQVAVFTAVNIAAALIALGCLGVSRYLLGFTSLLADNIAGNIIGTGLGTAFRFAAYRRWVFPSAATADSREQTPRNHRKEQS